MEVGGTYIFKNTKGFKKDRSVNNRINISSIKTTGSFIEHLALSDVPPEELVTCVKGKPNYNLRSNTDSILRIPRKTLKTLSDRAFRIASPRYGNICEVKNLKTFKSTLKTHLFKVALLK